MVRAVRRRRPAAARAPSGWIRGLDRELGVRGLDRARRHAWRSSTAASRRPSGAARPRHRERRGRDGRRRAERRPRRLGRPVRSRHGLRRHHPGSRARGRAGLGARPGRRSRARDGVPGRPRVGDRARRRRGQPEPLVQERGALSRVPRRRRRAYFRNVHLVSAANNVPGASYPSLFSLGLYGGRSRQPDPWRFYYNPDPPVEFGAWGVDVPIAWKDGGSTVATGNSFAAPHIAGLVALILAKHRGLRHSSSRRSLPPSRTTRAAAGRRASVFTAYRRLLRNRNLARLLLGEFVSGIGDWLYLVAILIVIYAETRSAVLLGIMGAARILPYVILSVPAGFVVDHFDRRMVLLVTDIAPGPAHAAPGRPRGGRRAGHLRGRHLDSRGVLLDLLRPGAGRAPAQPGRRERAGPREQRLGNARQLWPSSSDRRWPPC